MPLKIFSRKTGASRNYLWIAGIILGIILLTMPASGDPPLGVGSGTCLPDYYGDWRCCTDPLTTLDCIQYPCLNYCDYEKCWADDPASPPISCSNSKIFHPGSSVSFYGLLDHVRINDPNGDEIENSLVIGRTAFPACPSGPGVYSVHMDLVFYDCYTCDDTTPTPTTEPTQTITPNVTPTLPEADFTFPTPGNNAPIADFTANPRSGTAPLTVSFTDTSTRAPTAWSWSFGDGTKSTLRNPTHIYNSAGTYDVSLTAANVYGGDTEVKNGYVTVTPGPEVFTYAVTNANGAKDPTTGRWVWNENSRYDIDDMKNYLANNNNWNNVHWRQLFSKEGAAVTKGVLETTSSGEDSLNDATLFYHTGHGDWPDRNSHSDLKLVDEDYNSYSLSPDELQGAWGGNNKWVILSTCFSLRDERWDGVFASTSATHGILGFKTESYPHSNFMQTFFEYAKTKSVRDAFLSTVQKLDKTTRVPSPNGGTEHLTAVTIFSNQNQAKNDFLPGFGSGIQPDADPVRPYRVQWPPQSEGGV